MTRYTDLNITTSHSFSASSRANAAGICSRGDRPELPLYKGGSLAKVVGVGQGTGHAGRIACSSLCAVRRFVTFGVSYQSAGSRFDSAHEVAVEQHHDATDGHGLKDAMWSQLPLHEFPYLASLTSIQGPKSEIRETDTDIHEFSNMLHGFRWGPRINTFTALMPNSDNTFESRFPCRHRYHWSDPSGGAVEIGASAWAQGRASDSLPWIHLRRSRPASVKIAVQTRYKILLYSARCGYIYCILLS